MIIIWFISKSYASFCCICQISGFSYHWINHSRIIQLICSWLSKFAFTNAIPRLNIWLCVYWLPDWLPECDFVCVFLYCKLQVANNNTHKNLRPMSLFFFLPSKTFCLQTVCVFVQKLLSSSKFDACFVHLACYPACNDATAIANCRFYMPFLQTNEWMVICHLKRIKCKQWLSCAVISNVTAHSRLLYIPAGLFNTYHKRCMKKVNNSFYTGAMDPVFTCTTG